MSEDLDLVNSILYNDMKKAIENTHENMLKKYPDKKEELDRMKEFKITKLNEKFGIKN